MYSTTFNNQLSGQDVFKVAAFFSHRLDFYLAPLLLKLDDLLDKRLVKTFSSLCQSIIRLRSRSTGLLLRNCFKTS